MITGPLRLRIRLVEVVILSGIVVLALTHFTLETDGLVYASSSIKAAAKDTQVVPF